MISYNKQSKAQALIDTENRKPNPDFNFIKYLKGKFNL